MLLTVMSVLEERLPTSQFYFSERDAYMNEAFSRDLDKEVEALASPRHLPLSNF